MCLFLSIQIVVEESSGTDGSNSLVVVVYYGDSHQDEEPSLSTAR